MGSHWQNNAPRKSPIVQPGASVLASLCLSIFLPALAHSQTNQSNSGEVDGQCEALWPQEEVSSVGLGPTSWTPVPARSTLVEPFLSKETRRAGRWFRIAAATDGMPAASVLGGPFIRYRVLVEQGLDEEVYDLLDMVEKTLGDPQGWGSIVPRMVRVDEHPDINVVLAKPRTVNALCQPLLTASKYSCGLRRSAILNVMRWRLGSITFRGDLETYRQYLVNHEVGHLLGVRHRRCPPGGGPAPVMMQQTKHMRACTPNGRPLSDELEELRLRTEHRTPTAFATKPQLQDPPGG